MAYDLTNLNNVTNYLAQQQQGGSYVPDNGSLGKPSMGWDGWNGYNPAQTYSASAQTGTSGAQSPMGSQIPNGQFPLNSNSQGNRGPVNSFGGGGAQWGNNATGGQGGFFKPQQPHPVRTNMNPNLSNGMNPQGATSGSTGLSQTLQGVQDYGNQYGQNAYQFRAGVNDYTAKLQSWQQMGQITGQTPEEVAMAMTGKGLDYWQKMQQMYDQGLHPTTDTQV